MGTRRRRVPLLVAACVAIIFAVSQRRMLRNQIRNRSSQRRLVGVTVQEEAKTKLGTEARIQVRDTAEVVRETQEKVKANVAKDEARSSAEKEGRVKAQVDEDEESIDFD